MTWERHGDVLVLKNLGWVRALLYRDENCAMYFCITTSVGNFPVKECSGNNKVALKRKVVSMIRAA